MGAAASCAAKGSPGAAGNAIDHGVPAEKVRRGDDAEAVRDAEAAVRAAGEAAGRNGKALPEGSSCGDRLRSTSFLCSSGDHIICGTHDSIRRTDDNLRSSHYNICCTSY